MDTLLEVRDLRTHFATDRGLFRAVDGISFTFFNARDVVRHALVQRIVNAYDAFESQ